MSGDLFDRADAHALRASLAALDAAADAIAKSRAAVRAALGDDEDDPAGIDLSDRGRWLSIPEAAHIRQCSIDTIRRNIDRYGIKIDGRWWIDRIKLMRGRA